MSKKIILISSFSLLIISGCSSKYAVTFDSQPQGASLVCSGKNWGYTPTTLYYDEKVKEQSTLDISECSANWVSGAKKTYSSAMTIYPDGGTHTTVNRPNVKGYAQDANFALQVQTMKYQRQQAQAASESAYQQRRNANANRQQAYQLQQQNYQLQQMNNYVRYGY